MPSSTVILNVSSRRPRVLLAAVAIALLIVAGRAPSNGPDAAAADTASVTPSVPDHAPLSNVLTWLRVPCRWFTEPFPDHLEGSAEASMARERAAHLAAAARDDHTPPRRATDDRLPDDVAATFVDWC